MGERSITKIIATDGTAKFYLHWGSPCYQIPRLGQWAHEMALHGQPLTVAAWESWAAQVNGETGGVVAAERYDGPNPGDLGHEYVLTAEGRGGFVFEYRQRSLSRYTDFWRTVVLCNSVAELLAAGVDQLTTFRAQTARYRKEHGYEPDAEVMGMQTVAELTAWRDECQERAALHAELFAPGLAIRRPDADAMPKPRRGQGLAAYQAECIEWCLDASRNTLELAAKQLEAGEVDVVDDLQAEARGLLVEAHRLRTLVR